ncbi:MAG: TIGR01777 family protein [Omnitrophica bacterium RIFCSPLOWO2_01_FULL_50_24]|nr:MAG: TIGR01777 family protein [Omnitrophica bacterium RIFCSPLOWO2_01_FULL_50_24]
MHIVIAGGTGFVGTPLAELLIRNGHELTLLTRTLRRTASRSAKVRHVEWNPEDESSTVREIDGCDAVINLAGEPIAERWSRRQKERIVTSRVNSTQILVHSIRAAARKPSVLINASAVGFYGPRGNESLDENSNGGKGFLASVCKAWEAHAIRAEDFGVRVVRIRIGLVLERSGGALQKMIPPFQMLIGGWLGTGNQWMSWIHRSDLIKLIEFCLTHGEVKGAVNAAAPKPVTNREFSNALARALRRPCWAPVPGFVLRILLGEMAGELLLEGQRVYPHAAPRAGFEFRYSEIREALDAIFHS